VQSGSASSKELDFIHTFTANKIPFTNSKAAVEELLLKPCCSFKSIYHFDLNVYSGESS
jgi:hypothetical protein